MMIDTFIIVDGTEYTFKLDNIGGKIDIISSNQKEPYRYLLNPKIDIYSAIGDGSIKMSKGQIINNTGEFLADRDIRYIINHYDLYLDVLGINTDKDTLDGINCRTERAEEASVSLDALGIILENVEVVSTDLVKIIARNSKNVTGEKLDKEE